MGMTAIGDPVRPHMAEIPAPPGRPGLEGAESTHGPASALAPPPRPNRGDALAGGGAGDGVEAVPQRAASHPGSEAVRTVAPRREHREVSGSGMATLAAPGGSARGGGAADVANS